MGRDSDMTHRGIDSKVDLIIFIRFLYPSFLIDYV